MLTFLSRGTAAWAGTIALAMCGVTATATPASAEVKSGHIKICASGKYSASVSLPSRGDIRSPLVPSGSCLWWNIGFTSSEITLMNVHGTSVTPLGTFWRFDVGIATFKPSVGVGVATLGTASDPDFRVWHS
ncbi:hypothetical protein ACWGK1_14965 [Streptomyces wedmorensis]